MTPQIALPTAKSLARETYEHQRAAGRSHNIAFEAAIRTFRDCRPERPIVDAEAATWAAIAPALTEAASEDDT